MGHRYSDRRACIELETPAPQWPAQIAADGTLPLDSGSPAAEAFAVGLDSSAARRAARGGLTRSFEAASGRRKPSHITGRSGREEVR